jgi:hypothetical protein
MTSGSAVAVLGKLWDGLPEYVYDTATEAALHVDRLLRRVVVSADELVTRNLPEVGRRVAANYLESLIIRPPDSISGRLAVFACSVVARDVVPLALVCTVIGAVVGIVLCQLLDLFFLPILSLLRPSRVYAGLRTRILNSAASRRRIEEELGPIRNALSNDFGKIQGLSFSKLPEEGVSEAKITAQLTAWSDAELKHCLAGKLSGQVYHQRDVAYRVAVKAYELFSLSNPLHPASFPSVRKMEAEVIAMTAALFRSPRSCGAMTSGGTESIIMAVLAYKRWGRTTKGIVKPNIVVPVTAHAAFEKASQYLDVEIRKVNVDGSRMRAVPARMRSAIDSNTVALVCSAVSFPHGVLDPVEEIAAIAARRHVGCHVDGTAPCSRFRAIALRKDIPVKNERPHLTLEFLLDCS